MNLPHDLSYLCGGAFLVNAVPHLVVGVRGERFPNAVRQAARQGLSSSIASVLWAAANLFVAYLLLARVGDISLCRPRIPSRAAGLLTMALLARMFGRLHGGYVPPSR